LKGALEECVLDQRHTCGKSGRSVIGYSEFMPTALERGGMNQARFS